MNVEVEPIGRILRGIEGSDEYVLVHCDDDDIHADHIVDFLRGRYGWESNRPGGYFCAGVNVVPHAQDGKYIGIIYHRYDV
jgi:hypothetical protein